MKKKIISILLAGSLVLGALPGNIGSRLGAVAHAAEAEESFEYRPVKELTLSYEAGNAPKTGTRKIALLDQNMTLASPEGTFLTKYQDYDSQRAWLSRNGYLLNDFFTLEESGGSTINFQGEKKLGEKIKSTKSGTYSAGYQAGSGLTGLVGTGNGRRSFQPSREWYYAALLRNGISTYGTEYDQDTVYNGNAVNMVAKGDLEYSYALEGYSAEITQMDGFAGLYGHKYVFRGLINALGHGADVDSLGRFKKFNIKNDGSMQFSSLSNYWSSAKKLQGGGMWFQGYGRDNVVSPVRYQKITVYGKDTQGPQIVYSAVYDRNPVYQKGEIIPEGKAEGFMNWNLAPITGVGEAGKELYIALVFDEPVIFKEGEDQNPVVDLSTLTLNVETMGISGSEASPAAARFYSFAPNENTGLPVMVFRYTVPTDNAVRGEYYRFNKVIFNEKDNQALFENITDLSGNPLGGKASGIQEGFEKNLVKAVVDLRRLDVKSVGLEAGEAENVPKNAKLSVTVSLTKEIANKEELEKTDSWPVLTLNVLDETGEYVTIGGEKARFLRKDERGNLLESFYNVETAETSDSGNSAKSFALRFSALTKEGWRLEEGADRILVKSLSLGENRIADEAGNVLEGEIIKEGKNKEGTKLVPDRSYQLDYQAMSLILEDSGFMADGESIYRIPFTVTDNASLKGCSGRLSFYTNPSYYGEPLEYVVLYTDTPADSDPWKTSGDGTGESTLVFEDEKEQKGYLFLRLPDRREIGELVLKLEGLDSAGNAAGCSKSVMISSDSMEPRVKTEWVDERTIRVTIADLSEVTWSYDWKVIKTESERPEGTETHVKEQGTEKSFLLSNANIGTDRAFYESEFTLEVAENGKKVTSSLKGSFDNTSPNVELSSEIPTDAFVSGAPWVDVTYTDVAQLYYCWMSHSIGDTDGELPGGYHYATCSWTQIDLDKAGGILTHVESVTSGNAAEGTGAEGAENADTVSGNSSNASDSIKETENGSNASGITEAGGNSSNKQEHTGKQLAAVSGNGTLAQNGDARENEVIPYTGLYAGQLTLRAEEASKLWLQGNVAKDVTQIYRPLGLVIRAVDASGNSTYKSITFRLLNTVNTSGYTNVDASGRFNTWIDSNFRVWDLSVSELDTASAGGYHGAFQAGRDVLLTGKLIIGKAYEGSEIDYANSFVTVQDEEGKEIWKQAIEESALVKDDFNQEILAAWGNTEGLTTGGTNEETGEKITDWCSHYRYTTVLPAEIFAQVQNRRESFSVTLELKPYTPQPIGNAQTVEFAENGRKATTYFDMVPSLQITGGVAGIKTLQLTGEGEEVYGTYQVSRNWHQAGTQARLSYENGQIIDHTQQQRIEISTLAKEEDLKGEGWTPGIPELVFYAQDGGINEESKEESGSFKDRSARMIAGTEQLLCYDEDREEFYLEIPEQLEEGFGAEGSLENRYGSSQGGYNRIGEWPQKDGADGEPGYENALLGELYQNLPLQYGSNEVYYQFVSDSGEKSPIYKLELFISRPKLTYERMPAALKDGRKGTGPVTVELTISGYEDLKEGKVTASYEDGRSAEVLEDTGRSDDQGPDTARATGQYRFLFGENGTVLAVLTDKEGNCITETIPIEDISKAPALKDVKSNSTTKIHVTGKTDERAAELAFRFDTAYEAWIAQDGKDSGQWHRLEKSTSQKESGTKEGTVSKDVSATRENFPGMLAGTAFLSDGSFTILAEAKSVEEDVGVDPASITIRAEDSYGNASEVTIPLQVKGEQAKADPAVYSYGDALVFNQPVHLTDPDTGLGKQEYQESYDWLPIYESGSLSITYEDLFGRQWQQKIEAELEEAYAHSVTASITAPTREDVTVTISVLAKDLFVKGEEGVERGSGLVRIGKERYYRTGRLTFTENGEKTYTLALLDPSHEKVLQTLSLKYRVGNIDKTPPVPAWERVVNGSERLVLQEDGTLERTVYGSVIYRILGFDEENVTFTEGSNMLCFTQAKEGAFYFCDEAGNAGSLRVSELSTKFEEAQKAVITDYLVDWYLGDELVGTFGKETYGKVTFPKTARRMTAVITALNAEGETVDASYFLAKEDGQVKFAQLYKDTGRVVFEGNGSVRVVLQGVNEVEVPLLVENIHREAPKGRLLYGNPEAGSIKVYVEHEADSRIITPGALQDERGEYFLFTENGEMEIVLEDEAGNTNILVAKVYVLDNKPPVLTFSQWLTQSGNLTDVTKGAVRLYLECDELLSKAELWVFREENGLSVRVPEEEAGLYARENVLGNTVTVEFDQNCQVGILCYDLSGNVPRDEAGEPSPWLFPQDGALSIIDRRAPVITDLKKVYDGEDNTIKLQFTFDEPVTSTFEERTDEQEEAVYDSSFEKTVTKNGSYRFSFADKAGNTTQQTLLVTEIDETAPKLTFWLKELNGDTLPLSRDPEGNVVAKVRSESFYLRMSADEAETCVVVKNTGERGREETILLGRAESYGEYLVEENGNYQLIAADRYGNTAVSVVRIDFLDKEAPILTIPADAVEVTAGTLAATVKAALRAGVKANEACELTVALDETLLKTPGNYVIPIEARDSAGNRTQKTRRLKVLSQEGRYFTINGKKVIAGGLCRVQRGQISIEAPKEYTDELAAGGKARLTWGQGYLTGAQMKYQRPFTDAFEATETGFYTVMLSLPNRESYLIYLYVE